MSRDRAIFAWFGPLSMLLAPLYPRIGGFCPAGLWLGKSLFGLLTLSVLFAEQKMFGKVALGDLQGAMSDIFNEIDEEVRRDKVLQFWQRHQNSLIVLLLAVVLGSAGFTSWQQHQKKQAELLSARYEAAIEESRAGRSDDAERILAELVKEAPDGYKLLSRFRLAAETGKADPTKSIAAYDVLAADGSLPVLLRDIARYRAAVLASGQIDAKALAARLEPLTAKPGPMTGLAQELLGLSAMQAGDYDQAGRLFDAITIDRTSPQSLRQRVEIYLGLIRGGPVQSSS